MTKRWQIALYEYQRNVFKKSFFITLLSVPLMMTLAIGSGFIIETMGNSNLPIGYVDLSGVLSRAIQVSDTSVVNDPISLIPFDSEAAARSSLEHHQIQAYYLLPDDYLQTREVKLIYIKRPGENTIYQFFDFLQINLVASQPKDIAYRIAAGTSVTVRSLNGKRTVPDSGPTYAILMPLIITGAFLALLFMCSGYLMSALSDEKENRTIEILATSASAQEIISGKVVGILAIGLTLLVTWIVVVVAGLLIASKAGVGWFQNLEMDWNIILASTLIAIPAFVLASALMAAIGAMVTTYQEGQSFSAIIAILHMAPIYLSWGFLTHPNSWWSVGLSVMPFTALLTVIMRNIFGYVPPWQVAVSVFIQSLCALASIWLAGRAFRLGMLRYGQRLSWRKLLPSKYRTTS